MHHFSFLSFSHFLESAHNTHLTTIGMYCLDWHTHALAEKNSLRCAKKWLGFDPFSQSPTIKE